MKNILSFFEKPLEKRDNLCYTVCIYEKETCFDGFSVTI